MPNLGFFIENSFLKTDKSLSRHLWLRCLLVLVGTLSFQANLYATDDIDTVEDLNTPRAAVINHLLYLQSDRYQPETSARSFELQDQEKAKQIAIKLKQIYDGRGYFIAVDHIPDDPNYRDSILGQHRYIVVPELEEISLEKRGEQWLYTAKSIRAIEKIHAEVFPFGTDFLVKLFPRIGHKRFFGLELWQHFGFLLLILLGFIAHKLIYLLIGNVIHSFIRSKVSRQVADRFLLPISRPISFIIVVVIILNLLPILQLPPKGMHLLTIAMRATIPLFATILFYRLADIVGAYLEKMAAKTETTLDDQLAPLVRKSLKLFVILTGTLFILQNLEFDITALLAGLSIGGLALALAAQDTIKNLFGSIMIFLDRPFQIGDWIIIGDGQGTVEEVGFRSTRIRSFANSLIYVPNGKLVDMTIDNMGMRRYRRMSTTISITYDTPADLILAFRSGMEEIVKKHPDVWQDFYIIRLSEMGSHSLNIMFYIFFDVPNWLEEMRCKEEVLTQIIRLAEELGVRFAFPTSTIHVEDFPEKKGLTPHYKESKEEFENKVKAFFMQKKG